MKILQFINKFLLVLFFYPIFLLISFIYFYFISLFTNYVVLFDTQFFTLEQLKNIQEFLSFPDRKAKK